MAPHDRLGDGTKTRPCLQNPIRRHNWLIRTAISIATLFMFASFAAADPTPAPDPISFEQWLRERNGSDARTTPPSSEQPSAGPNVGPKVREQAHRLAKFLSMRNDATVGLKGPADVCRVLEDWTSMREISENPYDSHHTLNRAHQLVFAYILETHGSILPELQRITLPSPPLDLILDSPELAIGYALFSSMMILATNQAILNWQISYDDRCRAAFSQIMPLLRVNAHGKEVDGTPIRVREWYFPADNGYFLEAVNESEITLENVTLQVTLQTLDGQSSDHFYFIDEWPSQRADSNAHRYPLRLAGDWWKVGTKGTTHASVTVYSDQIKAVGMRSTLQNHFVYAAETLLRDIEREIKLKKRLTHSINRLTRIRSHTLEFPHIAARIRSLTSLANENLAALLDPINEAIKEIEEEISKLAQPTKAPPRNATKEDREKHKEAEKKRLDKRADAIKKRDKLIKLRKELLD